MTLCLKKQAIPCYVSTKQNSKNEIHKNETKKWNYSVQSMHLCVIYNQKQLSENI